MQVKVLRNISRAVTQKEQLENFQRIAATIIRFHHVSIDFFLSLICGHSSNLNSKLVKIKKF